MDIFSLKGKVALVTGGGSGIGFAIAQGLLAQGYEVVITARSIAAAKQAADKLGEKAIPLGRVNESIKTFIFPSAKAQKTP